MRDLDAADLGEVRRRVVDPVLRNALRPGELDSIELSHTPPDVWPGQPVAVDDAPDVWLTIVARSEIFITRPMKVAFERWDAHAIAVGIADQLEDWLPETSFSWGERRTVNTGPVIPYVVGSRPSHHNGVRVHFYPDAEFSSLLWDDGPSNLHPNNLGLSTALVEELALWRERWQELAEGYVIKGNTGWLAMVNELEPERRELVDALRHELPIEYSVTEPIALDQLTRESRSSQV